MSASPQPDAAAAVDDRLQRMIGFMRRSTEMTADQVQPFAAGFLISTPSLPSAWGLNHVRIVQPVSFAALIEMTEQHMHGLPYRHVVVEHEAAGERLEEPFREAGWKVDRELLMALGTSPDPMPTLATVIEPSEDEMIAMMARWHLEEHPNAPADEVGQIADYTRLEGRVWNERRLAIAGENGGLGAITKLRSDGSIAQVEDVYTAPEARRRGHARALVSHAVGLARAAGHELIFIVADDDDWPKQLYGRIGFEPVGRMRDFHRELARLP